MDALRRNHRALFLAGGGMKTAAYLGALELLGAEGFASLSGVSAGALLALLLTAGYAPKEIVELFYSEDWNRLFADSFSFGRLSQGRAPATRRFVRSTLASWLRARGVPSRATFGWLAARRGRPSFACFAVDLDAAVIRRFDAASSAEVRVLDAVMASMAVPLFYEPVVIEGRRYVDAALVNNAPLSLCPERPLLVMTTKPPPAPLTGWGSCLAAPWLRSCLLTAAELLCFSRGCVVHMPSPPADVHVFRLDRGSLRLLLSQGRLALFARLHSTELLALLALAVARLLTPR